MSFPPNKLDLILEYLHEEGSGVFATPEDADFFRKRKTVVKVERVLEKKEKFTTENTEPTEARSAQMVKIKEPPPKPVVPVVVVKEEPVVEPKPSFDIASVRNILSVVAPELAIINEIPSDATAKKIAERWKTKNQSAPISILLYQEPAEQRALLEQVAKALDVYFGPAKVVYAERIEKEKQWEMFLSVADLKMVIVCDYTLWQLNGLMHFYKETPALGVRTLGNIPLFLLPDLSLYLKDPLLKRSLWKALCQKFS